VKQRNTAGSESDVGHFNECRYKNKMRRNRTTVIDVVREKRDSTPVAANRASATLHVSGAEGSRRHGGALVGLAHKESSKLPKLKYETLKINRVFAFKPPCTNVNLPY